MCDYSLHTYPNRLAADGEDLVVHRFGAGSLGLASPADLAPVISACKTAQRTVVVASQSMVSRTKSEMGSREARSRRLYSARRPLGSVGHSEELAARTGRRRNGGSAVRRDHGRGEHLSRRGSFQERPPGPVAATAGRTTRPGAFDRSRGIRACRDSRLDALGHGIFSFPPLGRKCRSTV